MAIKEQSEAIKTLTLMFPFSSDFKDDEAAKAYLVKENTGQDAKMDTRARLTRTLLQKHGRIKVDISGDYISSIEVYVDTFEDIR